MFLRLPRWLSPAVRFRSAGIANTYTPPRFRPSLQPMEDRLCPATWTGADLVNPNDAGDPDNWDTGEVPGTGLDLVAQFDGTSSEDCDGLSGALEFKTGTVAAHNDPKMKMTGGTSTKISLDFNDAVRITGVNHVELYTNDHLDISSTLASEPATWNTNFPLFNYGGTLKLFNSVTVTFSGEVVTPTATYPNTPYVQDGASSTFIENGSNLSVGATKWMRMTRGKLSTLYNENLPDTVADQTGTLTGNLRIDGGEITICDGIVVHHYGTFMVEGAVIMTGGTYKPVIDVGQSGHCDVWKTRSNFDVNSHPNYTASLSPISLGTPVATGSWIIISSLQGSFTGNFTGSNLVYDPGPPAKEYTPGTLGMPPYAVTLNI